MKLGKEIIAVLNMVASVHFDEKVSDFKEDLKEVKGSLWSYLGEESHLYRK